MHYDTTYIYIYGLTIMLIMIIVIIVNDTYELSFMTHLNIVCAIWYAHIIIRTMIMRIIIIVNDHN